MTLDVGKAFDQNKNPWASAAFAGLGAMYGLLGLLSGRDELRAKMEDAQRARSLRVAHTDSWRLLSKAYAEIVLSTDDPDEKKRASTEIKVLATCINEYDREIVLIDSFIESARAECEKREKDKLNVERERTERLSRALKRTGELEGMIMKLEDEVRNLKNAANTAK